MTIADGDVKIVIPSAVITLLQCYGNEIKMGNSILILCHYEITSLLK